MFEPFAAPPTRYSPPALGDSTEHGVSWHDFVHGVNERFAALFSGHSNGPLKAVGGTTVTDEEVELLRGELAEARGSISELRGELDNVKRSLTDLAALLTATPFAAADQGTTTDPTVRGPAEPNTVDVASGHSAFEGAPSQTTEPVKPTDPDDF